MFKLVRVVLLSVLFLVALPAAARADLIGVELDGTVVRIDERTATSRVVGESGIGPLLSLARDRSGAFFATSNFDLYTIDPVTAAATPIAPISFTGEFSIITGLAFSPDGTLYAMGSMRETFNNNFLFTLNPISGALSLVGETGVGGIADLAISSDGTLYAFSESSSEDNRIGLGLVTIDPLTGRATDVNPDDNSPQTFSLRALTFSASGTLYGMNSPDGLLSIDTASGTTRFIGLTGTDTVGGIAFVGPAAEPIPEPTTLLLLGTGLAGFGVSRRTRRPARRRDADTAA